MISISGIKKQDKKKIFIEATNKHINNIKNKNIYLTYKFSFKRY